MCATSAACTPHLKGRSSIATHGHSATCGWREGDAGHRLNLCARVAAAALQQGRLQLTACALRVFGF